MSRYCSTCNRFVNELDGKCSMCGARRAPSCERDHFVSGIEGGACRSIDLKPGTPLMERFTVREQLGHGNGSAVFLATDAVRGEEVALKVVEVGPTASEAIVGAFQREIGLHRRIVDHRHIIRVHDVHYVPTGGSGLLLLSMEHASGGTFRDWLRDHSKELEQRRPDGLILLKQACQGLMAVHAAGGLHLDVKPENLLIVDGLLRLSDFGASLVAESLSTAGDASDPYPLSARGTPAYMSPEQCQMVRHQDLGPASDVYSLGVVLYEFLDGARPFDGTADQLREKHVHLQPSPLQGSAAPWWPIVARCLAKRPDRRYANVRDLLTDLDRVSNGAVLWASVACSRCGHVNTNIRREKCEGCGSGLATLFRECVHCLRRNRMDLETCEGCGFAIAAYYLYQHRKRLVSKLQDEDPVAAIELLELMLRGGAKEEDLAQIRELRQKYAQTAPLVNQANQSDTAGQVERALAQWRAVLKVIPRHRTAVGRIHELESLLRNFEQIRNQAIEAMDHGRFDVAEHRLQELLKLIPRDDVRALMQASRKRGERYAAFMQRAISAAEAKRLREALICISGAVAEAPKSEKCRRLRHDVAGKFQRTRELMADAGEKLAAAKFEQAERLSREIVELQHDPEEMASFRKALDRTRRAYRRAISDAVNAMRVLDLDRVGKAAAEALRVCPEADEAKTMARTVAQNKAQAVQLTEAGDWALRAARFDQAEDCWRQAAKLWARFPRLQDALRGLGALKANYHQHIKEAGEALSHGRLSQASVAAWAACELCSDSEAAARLAAAIRAQQASTRDCVAGAKKSIMAAKFEEAADQLAAARKLWAAVDFIKQAESDLCFARGRYTESMNAARQALQQSAFGKARLLCNQAVFLCPKAAEVKNFVGQITAAEAAAKRLQERIHAAGSLVATLVLALIGVGLGVMGFYLLCVNVLWPALCWLGRVLCGG